MKTLQIHPRGWEGQSLSNVYWLQAGYLRSILCPRMTIGLFIYFCTIAPILPSPEYLQSPEMECLASIACKTQQCGGIIRHSCRLSGADIAWRSTCFSKLTPALFCSSSRFRSQGPVVATPSFCTYPRWCITETCQIIDQSFPHLFDECVAICGIFENVCRWYQIHR